MGLAMIILAAAQVSVVPVTPPAGSCIAGASALPAAVDGRTLRKPADIAALRKKAKDGSLILVDGGDFSGQKFSGSGFSNICFRSVRLTNTQWKGVKASGIGFINSDLSGADMSKARMDHILFRNTIVASATARQARFAYGQLDGGWDARLTNWQLEGAQLTGFRFKCGTSTADGCGFERKAINLRGADLSGAQLASFTLWEPLVDGVILNETEIGLDHVPLLASAAGPVIVREGNYSARFSASDYAGLHKALVSANPDNAKCTAIPLSPLRKIICEEPSGRLLRAERENIRLYSTVAPTAAPSPAQQSYENDLDDCATKEEDVAAACLAEVFEDRRDSLVAQQLASQPMERNGRALFVSDEVPYLRQIMTDPALSRVGPILAGSARAYLLVSTDSSGAVSAVATTTDAYGRQCSARREGRGVRTMTPRIWMTGADFGTIRPRNRSAASVSSQTCQPGLSSGPLVRIPVSNDDFDRLMKAVP
jgi:uncharacterized protein YjbI with pentapeptide repeats